MLHDYPSHTTIPASDMERARKFYEEELGFTATLELPSGIMYESKGTKFVLFPSKNAGTAPHTLMGWQVDNINAVVSELKGKGVVFEEYDTPTLKTTNSVAENGPVKAAWLKDSEGNILGIIQINTPE